MALQRRLDARQAAAGRLAGDARVDDDIIWALALEALAKQRHPAARLADAVSRRQAVPIDQNGSPSGLGAACENYAQQERSDGEGHRQGGEERRERSRHSAGHRPGNHARSEEHTSELQSPCNLVCRLLLEKKKTKHPTTALDLLSPPDLTRARLGH